MKNDITLLEKSTIDDLKEYRKNATKYLKIHDQYATAKVVEEMFDIEIALRILKSI